MYQTKQELINRILEASEVARSGATTKMQREFSRWLNRQDRDELQRVLNNETRCTEELS